MANMKEYKLESGNVLKFGYASFEDGMALMQAVAKATASGGGLANEMQALGLISNPDVLACIFACLKKCFYQDKKIERVTFELEETRPDFVPVAIYVMNENINVFTKGLSSS